MLTLFKGELTLDDILHGLPKKRLMELRETRIRILQEEREEMARLEKEREREATRKAIVAP